MKKATFMLVLILCTSCIFPSFKTANAADNGVFLDFRVATDQELRDAIEADVMERKITYFDKI